MGAMKPPCTSCVQFVVALALKLTRPDWLRSPESLSDSSQLGDPVATKTEGDDEDSVGNLLAFII